MNQDRLTKRNTTHLSNTDTVVYHDNNRSTGSKRDISSVDEATKNMPKRVKNTVSRHFKSHFKLKRKTPKRKKTVSNYNMLKYYMPTLPTIPEESIL